MIRRCGLLMTTLLLVASLPAQAEAVRRPASGAAGAQVQALLQQISAERDALKADAARMKADLEKAQQERDAAQAKVDGAEQEAARLREALAAFQAQNEALRARLGEAQTAIGGLRDEQSATSAALAQARARGETLDGDLAQCRARVDELVGHNLRLFEIGNELLDRYEHKGVWSTLKAAEPFTGLKRVELENIVQDYRFALDDQRVDAPAAPPAAQ